ncbi:Vesicle-Associated Membrane Protein 8 [Didymosphaeria variabile]|uniref:Vesicle-Associated Membrane Protein 8 n=1 Tax=Didymosphaeria variabile TaxID=1932322 RepID=A0A9W9CE76_9PLEO|nr:Vesicle-Associated Membrane Protein 8 [Didymosphaeria variabile]KAJ4357665.1 Vesicle-Associated Membrane Protein 8 [Didymosphaeria variabile]
MAEFVASLIGIAGLGAKVSITLHKVVSTLNSAQNDARLIAADISIFTCTLTQLSKTISDCNVPEAAQLFEIAQVLVPACSTLVHELQRLIGNTELYQMKGAFSVHLLALRFKWLLNGPKVTFVKSLLESFKSTLVLLISTMDLAVVMHQDAQSDVKYVARRSYIAIRLLRNMKAGLDMLMPYRESLKSQVRTNLHLAEDAKANLLLFQDPKYNSDPSTILDVPDSQSTNSDTASSAVTVVDPSIKSLVPYDMDGPNATQSGDLRQITMDGETDELTCLSECPQELSGILIAQESTVKLAEDLLKIAHVPTWTWGTSAAVRPSEQQMHVPIVHKDNSPNQVNESATTSRPGLPNPGAKTKSSQNDVLNPGSQIDDRASAESLNPLQYLDKEEESQNNPLRSPSSDNLDLQTMIKKILEETLASHNSEHASQPRTEPEKTAQLQKPTAPEISFKSDVQDGTERLSKLERIMLAERDEMIRKKAIAEAERQVQKKISDADKLEKLEGLILAQKEEQFKREEAVEATRKADRAEADAKVAKRGCRSNSTG